MSTDSTELTFVRCPSCRSLVPAISTRCRMCGATLEASAAPDAGEQEQRKSGRVRQRTMSEASSDVSSAVSQVRDESAQESAAPIAPPAEPVVVAPEVNTAQEQDFDDPLSAYIEEVDSKESVENGTNGDAPGHHAAEEEKVAAAFDDDDDTDDESEDLLGTEVQEPEVKTVATAPRVIVESGRKPGKSQLDFGGAPKEPATTSAARSGDEAPKTSTPPQSQKPQAPEQRKQEARPPQQQQQQKQSQGGGQSSRSDQPNRQQQQRQQQPQQRQPQQQQQRGEQQSKHRQEQRQPEIRESREERQTPPAAARQQAPAFQPGAQHAQGVSGRLYGWFVNYSDPSGAAVEIREGKFFVSSKSVKPSDLVINDKSISSPHALLTVSAGSGLTIQDLMSERGVFVRGKGSDTYRREEEIVSVGHGDWVRFGDVEFLVSLIAHPGEV